MTYIKKIPIRHMRPILHMWPTLHMWPISILNMWPILLTENRLIGR